MTAPIRQKQSALSALGLANESLYQDTGGTSSSTGALPIATIDVSDGVTSQFPSTGGSFVLCFADGATTTVDYTGVTSDTFTGCTGGSGTLEGGEEVIIPPMPGNPRAAQSFLPEASASMVPDADVFSPKVMFGHRDLNTFALGGAAKYDGSLSGPLFPQDGTLLLFGGIGADAAPGSGVTPASSTGALTLSDASGAGSIYLVLSGTTDITAGTTIVAIDTNSDITTQECRLVKALNTDTITVDALQYAHAEGVDVKVATAPFTHTAAAQNLLQFNTVEEQLDNSVGEGMQFAGCLVDKLDIKVEATNTEVTITGSMKGQHYQSLTLAELSPVSITGENPYTGFEAVLTLFSVDGITQCKSFTLSVENAIDVDTCLGSHDPAYLTPSTVKFTGEMKMLFSSLTDSTVYGYMTKYLDILSSEGPQLSPLTLVITNPVTNYSVTINIAEALISKDVPDVRMESTIMETLSYSGFLDLNTSPATNLSISVVNNYPNAF